jgi:hypothetical protein
MLLFLNFYEERFKKSLKFRWLLETLLFRYHFPTFLSKSLGNISIRGLRVARHQKLNEFLAIEQCPYCSLIPVFKGAQA